MRSVPFVGHLVFRSQAMLRYKKNVHHLKKEKKNHVTKLVSSHCVVANNKIKQLFVSFLSQLVTNRPRGEEVNRVTVIISVANEREREANFYSSKEKQGSFVLGNERTLFQN